MSIIGNSFKFLPPLIGRGLSRAGPGPSLGPGQKPGLRNPQARALPSRARAGAFRPSRAFTSLPEVSLSPARPSSCEFWSCREITRYLVTKNERNQGRGDAPQPAPLLHPAALVVP